MPTKHRRVSVTVDAPLLEALERARRVRSEEPGGGEARLADASLIHELAIKGAEDLEREDAQRRRLLDELSDPDLTAARLDGDALREVLALRAENPFGSDA